LFRCEWFWDTCDDSSRGTSGRQRINPEKYLDIKIPLPKLEDQQRTVEKINAIQQKAGEIKILQETSEQRIGETVHSLMSSIADESDRKALKDVAPLIRRAVKIEPDEEYFELGLRSFGKGTFHKPAIRGDELNGKRLFRIEPGDLLFSNVFAWEGAVAVAQPEDVGRYGSHRFISRKAIEGVASADFLYYYFTTPEGVEQLGKASPGSAGRNRTLGLKMLDEIKVPLPSYEKQLWIVSIAKRLEQLGKRQALIKEEMDGLFKSVLDRAFQGAFT
jgi:type I restriction enzyme S subunit